MTTAASFWARVRNSVGAADSLAAQVTTGESGNYHLCGMGDRYSGRLGDGWLGWELTPHCIGSNAAQIAAGGEHSLFVEADGTLWAVGGNDYGQLGDGTMTSRRTPVLVVAGVARTAAGSMHSLFLCSPSAPVIATQPLSRTNIVGVAAAFSVCAVVAPPLSYQWRFDEVPLPGAINTALVISNVQTSQAGPYTVVTTNSLGAATSQVAWLTVTLISPGSLRAGG